MKRTSPPISEIDSFSSGLIVILLLTFFSLIFTSFSSPETSITSSSPSCSETFFLAIALRIASRRFRMYLSVLSFLPSLSTSPSSLPTGSRASVFDFALFLASISLFCRMISLILPDMPVKPSLEGSVCFLESSL